MAKTSRFWSFFLFVDTYMIPVWAVPDIFWNTVKGILGISISYKSFSFQNFPFYKKS